MLLLHMKQSRTMLKAFAHYLVLKPVSMKEVHGLGITIAIAGHINVVAVSGIVAAVLVQAVIHVKNSCLTKSNIYGTWAEFMI